MSLAPRIITAEPGRLRMLDRLLRSAAAVAIFALAGPPIGGLVAWGTMGVAGGNSPMPFVSGSYGEGLTLALATCVIVAVAAWFGRASWLVAVAAALMANVAFHLATASIGFSEPGFDDAMADVAVVFLPPSIVAALACWFAARPLLRAP